ncbi:MAG: SMI1/KNR4 family protein [Phycisphaerae bacterium]|jgi:hypothetical protein|nr:SMI1/KNR4 family protein [Phycisphaerae bacterium]
MAGIIDAFITFLETEKLANCRSCVPCTSDQIAEIEERFAVTLPQMYRDFLLNMGQGSGRFLRGSDLHYPEILDLREGAEDLLDECSNPSALKQDDFVFFMHQGYQFAYFSCNDGDDPPVWYYMEGDDAPIQSWPSFTAYLWDTAIEEGKGWRIVDRGGI